MGANAESSGSVPDHDQRYWQLASIQASAQGIPGMLLGSQAAVEYGPENAIGSIIIGNLILWMIGLTIISMASPDRNNAIQNVSRYLGKAGGLFAALVLILSFISWYLLQIDSSIIALGQLIPLKGESIRWGAALGSLTALLSIGGITFIKRFNVSVFPLIIVFFIYLAFQTYPESKAVHQWNFSILGVIGIVSASLAGVVNLPTFFRHAKSKGDAYLGLSLLILFWTLFQCLTIVNGYTDPSSIRASSRFDLILWLIFIPLMTIAVNLVNIYFASAGWEMIFPHRKSAMEYAIVGLLGTMAYTFLQISAPMQFLENMAENFIAGLGIVLMMAFLVRIVVRHRPRPFEKHVNIGCWLFGGILGTAAQAKGGFDPSEVFIISISASAVAFLAMVFVEETIWSFKKIIR